MAIALPVGQPPSHDGEVNAVAQRCAVPREGGAGWWTGHLRAREWGDRGNWVINMCSRASMLEARSKRCKVVCSGGSHLQIVLLSFRRGARRGGKEEHEHSRNRRADGNERTAPPPRTCTGAFACHVS